MFGPNAHFETRVVIDYSHRDPKFFDLFESVRDNFATKFGLTDYDILFLPGSGTIGVQAVMFSLLRRINVIGAEGVFTSRWRRMAAHYNQGRRKPVDLWCQLETSNSAYFESKGGVVDAISAFPYYEMPQDTKVLMTASNKLLGSYAGLAIVAVHKDYWPNLRQDTTFSYLNLCRYREYHRRRQTPSTAPTYLFEHLGECIENYDVEGRRQEINRICDLLVETVGEENVVGATRCPVITIRKKAVPKSVAEEFDLYGHWTGKSVHQIFTYSCRPEDYESFCEKIRRAR